MLNTDNFDQVEITSVEDLRNWLIDNHNQDKGVWLVTFKKCEITKYVSREEILDELLCFGWIDGIRRKLDEKKTMQLITKRRVQLKSDRKWYFLCKPCTQKARMDSANYRYGGTWKG